jgi:cyclophilin family peptidyl-prolyl cis-trans isomerase
MKGRTGMKALVSTLSLVFLLATVASAATAAEYALIRMPQGEIKIELHADKAPATVANFKKLVESGFYDGLAFHRVVPGFVAQGGDPKGDGTGGPGYTVEAEIMPQMKHVAGAVATARQGDAVNPQRRSSGSQFYICLAPAPHLDGAYTIFGQVVEGMGKVLKIRKGDRMEKIIIVQEK